MSETKRPATKQRVVAAASALFAERGFQRTTMRDIAARAGVNLAAGHYHYGSKKALYLEVLRAQFAAIRSVLDRRRLTRSASELARLPQGQLVRLLETRVRIMLDMLLGPPPGLHGTLMQREMCDPSEALPVIVEEFVRPIMREMEAVVAHAAPALRPADVERCVRSITGQALFYRFAMPAILLMLETDTYPPGFSRALARHITEFSLGGMSRVAAQRRSAHAG